MRSVQNLAGLVSFPEDRVPEHEQVCIAAWLQKDLAKRVRVVEAERIYAAFPDTVMNVVREPGNQYRATFFRLIPATNTDKVRREASAFARLMSKIAGVFVGITEFSNNHLVKKMAESEG